MSDAARTNKDMVTERIYTAGWGGGSLVLPISVHPAVRMPPTIKSPPQ